MGRTSNRGLTANSDGQRDVAGSGRRASPRKPKNDPKGAAGTGAEASIPPEQSSLNVSRQVPARLPDDAVGEEADAVDVSADAPNVADVENEPVADLSREEPAIRDSQKGEDAKEEAEIDNTGTAARALPKEQNEDELNQAIRERAYQIWLDEGQPDGRADAHWELASELTAIKESYRETLLPNPAAQHEENPNPAPVEEAFLQANLGEFPTLTDQGEEVTFPKRSHIVTEEAALSAPPLKKSRTRRAKS